MDKDTKINVTQFEVCKVNNSKSYIKRIKLSYLKDFNSEYAEQTFMTSRILTLKEVDLVKDLLYSNDQDNIKMAIAILKKVNNNEYNRK